jgi:hypothetical protein
VNGLDLAQEWEANPSAADAKYAGKVVEVEGAVIAFGRNDFKSGVDDGSLVMVGNIGVLFKEVRCEMREEDLRPKIARKSNVRIKGLWLSVPVTEKLVGVAYKATRDKCTLVNCVFTEIGPNPRISLTAEEMSSEARADRDQFRTKYGDNFTDVTVTGEIASQENKTYIWLIIKTSASPRIVFEMVGNRQDNEAIAKSTFPQGTKVRIEGGYSDNSSAGTPDIILHGSIILQK